jgi:hypothetical protein
MRVGLQILAANASKNKDNLNAPQNDVSNSNMAPYYAGFHWILRTTESESL